MTTYLANTRHQREAVITPFCSKMCAYQRQNYLNVREDDRYEFDEKCANCGRLIPASKDMK